MLECAEAGELVHVFDDRGSLLGSAYANPHSLITGRMLSRRQIEALDAGFWKSRLQAALSYRERMFPTPHYRWVHGEADGMPGLIVDRYGGDVVVQAHTAGIERHLDPLCTAIAEVSDPANIYLKNDARVRELDGLTCYTRVYAGGGDGEVAANESVVPGMPLWMRCQAMKGQKTGYFYDQRMNRRWVARFARGKRVLDLFAYVGAFAIQALHAGAEEVVSVDRSADSLAYARENTEAIGARDRWQGICADVNVTLGAMISAGERFDIVVCDPPAFAKGRKQVRAGLAGYTNLNRLAAKLVAPGGLLASSSCSGLVSEDEFLKSVSRGIREAALKAGVVHSAGAAPDHPWLAAMPETRYLKFYVFRIG